MSRHHAIIIGCGVAGPVLALFLKRAGISSSVYDSHTRPEATADRDDPRGQISGAFQVAPNGLSVLKELGIADELVARSAPVKEYRFLRRDGATLARFRNGRPEITGLTAISTKRAVFFENLLNEAVRHGIPVTFGKRLSEITANGDEVVAHFADGSTAQGTCLVGADGIASRTRAIIHPGSAQATYGGVVGFGSILSWPLDAEAQGCVTFVVGDTGQAGFSPIDDKDAVSWWVHVPEPKQPTKSDLKALTIESMKSKLLDRYGSWCEPVPTFIRMSGQIRPTAIYDVPDLEAWHRGNVALIGDAAHGMSPSSGQGASLALEDAMYLAKLFCTSRATTLKEIFSAYEHHRRPRVERIAAVARRRDERDRVPLGPVGQWIRDRTLSTLLPRLGELSLRKTFEYRIDWPQPPV